MNKKPSKVDEIRLKYNNSKIYLGYSLNYSLSSKKKENTFHLMILTDNLLEYSESGKMSSNRTKSKKIQAWQTFKLENLKLNLNN